MTLHSIVDFAGVEENEAEFYDAPSRIDVDADILTSSSVTGAATLDLEELDESLTEENEESAQRAFSERKKGFYERHVKRPMDFILSLIGLVVLSPVFLVVAILVRMKLGSPVIFKQERPGLNEKIFTLYKFRTMTDARDEDGNLLPDSQRLTGFGKTLRSTSLDELPELLNILKGDMSVVGPRPLLVEYLPYYTEEERRRHEVRPGVTGLAQVEGRNLLLWEEKFHFDLLYIYKIGFIEDYRTLFKTILKVVRKDEILFGDTLNINGYTLRPLHIEREEGFIEKRDW